MSKRQSYSFAESRHSGNGIFSTILGAGSLLLFGILLFLAWLSKGNSGAWIGAMGFTGIVFALCGILYGFTSFRDDCKYTLFCKIGTVTSAVAFVIWFFVTCIGIAQL